MNQTDRYTPEQSADVDYKEIIRKSAKHLLCIHGSVEGWDTRKDLLELKSLAPLIADLVAALEARKAFRESMAEWHEFAGTLPKRGKQEEWSAENKRLCEQTRELGRVADEMEVSALSRARGEGGGHE